MSVNRPREPEKKFFLEGRGGTVTDACHRRSSGSSFAHSTCHRGFTVKPHLINMTTWLAIEPGNQIPLVARGELHLLVFFMRCIADCGRAPMPRRLGLPESRVKNESNV